MSNTRRRFLNKASAALAATLAACRKPAPSTATPAPGTPPAFGVSPEVGPPVSPAIFAEAEKLVQFPLTASGRETAASIWRRMAAPLYERRTGRKKFIPPATLAPATLSNPLTLAPTAATAPVVANKDRFIRSAVPNTPLPASDSEIAFAPVSQLSHWL